jgi:hypothetical protein
VDDDEGNSLCAVYAILIENQLRSDDPDMEVVFEQLDNIKRFCHTMSFPPGEAPEHLEEYQYEEGHDDGGPPEWYEEAG